MDTQDTPTPNLETPFDEHATETGFTEVAHAVEPAVNIPKAELTTGRTVMPEYIPETAPELPATPELEPIPESPAPAELVPFEQDEHFETVDQPSLEPFMPVNTPLDIDPPEEATETLEPPELLNKSLYIVFAVRVATVALISIFFMRLFGGAGSTCSTTALPLNYACSLNYLWLAIIGVCGFAIIERIIAKVFHRKYSHVLSFAGFVLATYTFYQVSQLFAALSGSQQRLPNITVFHFMPALIAVLVTALGLLIAHFVPYRRVRRITAVAFPITALLLIIILPIVLTEHLTTITLANQIRPETTLKANLKNTATAAAAAGVNLYVPKNYTGPLQIKYVKPFFKTGDYPRYVLTFRLPSGKNLEMSAHKKDATNNPPTNCGDFLPYTIKPSTKLSSVAFPCKLVFTTDSGRNVYGFYDSSITDTIKLDSKEILKYQPSAYYIYIDTLVISFLDTTAASGQASTITSDVLRNYVNSLQLIKDKELQDHIDKYGV